MNVRNLLRATIVGTILQLVLIGLGDVVIWVQIHAFMFGSMMISATAGYLYAMDSAKGYFTGATGGAIAGGIAGFVAMAAAILLNEPPPFPVALGTTICVFTGAVGGVFGQVAANWRALEKRGR